MMQDTMEGRLRDYESLFLFFFLLFLGELCLRSSAFSVRDVVT